MQNISIMNDSSILIAKHKTSYTLNKIRSVIEKVFPENEDLSIKMPLADYRKIAAEAQEKLNADSIIKDIVTEIKSTLEEYVDGNELFQSSLYLRYGRPESSLKNNSFHRNHLWFQHGAFNQRVDSIKGVTKENTLPTYLVRKK